jgi:putative AdoMet-dependent methyltransferase
MMGSEEARVFDDWAGHYDESVRSSGGFPFGGYEAVLEQVVTLAAAEPGCQVLDLGIGTGNLAKHFVALKCQVWGIDFSPKMLAVAQTKLPRVHLTQADLAGTWPTEFRRRFDRIVSAYVFHHFDLAGKVSLLTRLIRDHCTDAGRIVVADVSFPTIAALEKAKLQWEKRWDEDEYYWVAEETVAACEQAGLRLQYRQVTDFAGVFVVESKSCS